MYWNGGLVIPAFQRFCSSQQVAHGIVFPLVLLQAKVVGTWNSVQEMVEKLKFPLVLLQAKVVGLF
mgnify:CR=1 FL=1